LRQELVDADEINSAVAGDRLGQDLLVGGFDQFIDQFGCQRVLYPESGFGSGGSQANE